MKKTPKEKAKELVDKYFEYTDAVDELNYAKKCALIDVGNTLWVLSNIKATTEILKQYRFWFEVKIEIKKTITILSVPQSTRSKLQTTTIVGILDT